MNRSPDVDLVLRDYFAGDGLTAPDHVLDVVEDRIARQRQRGSWRLPRRHPMRTPFKLAAGVAAVLVVALVAWRLMPGFDDGIGVPPTSTPSATLAPGPSPTRLPLAIHDGPLVGGRYLTEHFGVRFQLDIPGGWAGVAGGWLSSPDGLAAPDGLGIAFLTPDGVFSDPCRWDVAGTAAWPQPADVVVGPTVAELAAALAAQTAYESTDPVDVTLDGHDGKRIDLTFPAALEPRTCDVLAGQTSGVYLPFGASDAQGSNLFAQGPGQVWRVWIIDLAAERFVIVVDLYPGTSSATSDAARQIVESITFEP